MSSTSPEPGWVACWGAFVKGMEPRCKWIPCSVLGFPDGEVQEASGGGHYRSGGGGGAVRERRCRTELGV